EVSVVEGQLEPHRREVAEERRPVFWSELQLEIVAGVLDRAFVVMRLRAELRPIALPLRTVANEVDALVFRRVDITGPEEADVAIAKDVLARDTAEVEVDIVRLHKRKAGPALQVECGGRRLVQLGAVAGDLPQLHRRVARLEKHL